MQYKILITGASGFIGKNLIKFFIKRNQFKILSISRFKKKNKIDLKWIKTDFGRLNKKAINQIKIFKPTVVIHLGWQDIPNFSLKTSRLNLKKSKLFLNNIFKIKSVKKIIITGTCGEYLMKHGKAKEDTSLLDTKNFFSKSKIDLYNFAKKKSEKKNINFYWLRLFYVYGPNQRAESLVPYLFEKIYNNFNFNLNNPQKNLDFINVHDVVKIIELFIIKNFNTGIYNVGTGKKLSVAEIYNHLTFKILKRNFKKLKISKKDYFISDNKKLKKIIPNYNFMSLNKGLEGYFNWYLRN